MNGEGSCGSEEEDQIVYGLIGQAVFPLGSFILDLAAR